MGILLGHYWVPQPYVPLLITFLGCLLLGASIKRTTLFTWIFPFTILALGVLVQTLWFPQNRKNHYSHLHPEGTHTWQVQIQEVLKPNAWSQRYTAKVLQMDAEPVSGRILLTRTMDSLENPWQVDAQIAVIGSTKPIGGARNPHQFDYRSYMARSGIYDQLVADTSIVVSTEPMSFTGHAEALRNTLLDRLKEQDFGPDELAILQALLLGQRNDISPETYTAYANAGAIHILAVSGLHIGILLLLLQWLLQPLEMVTHGKWIKLGLVVLLLWGYAFLAGLSPSVIRAVTMFSFLAYAQFLNRPTNTFNILALSFFFILLFSPMMLFQLGFQLSYAAVFAIVWIYPKLQRLWSPKNKILSKAWQLFSVGAAAQLGVLPLSLYYFHQFPGLFFVTNLLLIPCLGMVLGLGFLVLLLASVNLLPHFLVWSLNQMVRGMNALVSWIAQKESFLFTQIPMDGVQLLMGIGLLIALIRLWDRFCPKRIWPVLGFVIGLQLWSLFLAYETAHTQRAYILHQNQNSSLLHQNGAYVFVFASDTLKIKPFIDTYTMAEHIAHVRYRPLENSYRFGDITLLRIDSLGVYTVPKTDLDYLWLSQNPNLHLGRLLDSIKPKKVIADGSNYPTNIQRWKATCAKRGIPFHCTVEEGAFTIPLK